jgi:hypothetical protein
MPHRRQRARLRTASRRNDPRRLEALSASPTTPGDLALAVGQPYSVEPVIG